MTQHLTEDGEIFSTPPLSPEPTTQQHSLSRKNSRPTSLLLDRQRTEWKPDIQLTTSPDFNHNAPGVLSPLMLSEEKTTMPTAVSQHPHPPELQKALTSPCFVHSHLDKGMLTDWLKTQSHLADINNVGLAKSLQHPGDGVVLDLDNGFDDDEDALGNSLTKHLAETAVAVRDMSKQLGQASIQSSIQTVLIVTKARDNRLIKLTRQLALYLMQKCRPGSTRGLVVYVDSQLRRSRRFDAEGLRRDHPDLFQPFPKRSSSTHSLSSVSSTSTHTEYNDDGQLRYWTSSMCRNSPHWFDFVVTLGGDGTVLFTSWLFQRIVPPVLPFALGSLGFLTNFNFSDHEAVMDSAIDNGIRVNLRMRFTCTVYRAVVNEETRRHRAMRKGNTGEIMMEKLEKDGWEALEGGCAGLLHAEKPNAKDKEIICFTTRPVETFEVLNDLVVDRGPSPYVSLLELFGDEHHMTTVQADGLTVATPTGSTAYSLSAGGSLVHPEIPAILITPICPHTLSFRPMLLPDTMELRICVPYNSRSTAWASFDGRGRVEIKQGDHIKVTASKYPFPTVCADKQSTDWFHAISRTLKWNERDRQKSFVVVEEDAPPVPRKRTKRKAIGTPTASTESIEDGEEDEHSEEEEENFDIDDSAAEADTTSNAERTTLADKIEKTKRKHALARLSRSRSRQRAYGSISPPVSGVASPNRYATMPPHSPAASLRHVGFNVPSSPSSSAGSVVSDAAHQGTRDNLRSPRVASGKNRIPMNHEFDPDHTKTPTAGTHHHHHRGRSFPQPEPRAFAVRGKDESDSTASDA